MTGLLPSWLCREVVSEVKNDFIAATSADVPNSWSLTSNGTYQPLNALFDPYSLYSWPAVCSSTYSWLLSHLASPAWACQADTLARPSHTVSPAWPAADSSGSTMSLARGYQPDAAG